MATRIKITLGDIPRANCSHLSAERKVAIYAPPPFDASQVKIELYGIPSKG